MKLTKRIELWGRHVLVRLVGWCLRGRRRDVALPEGPRILVVRLDERLGNLLLLTPLLDSLRQRFAGAHITLLANARGRALMQTHRAVSRFVAFRKRALWAADGPLRLPWRLRRMHFDLALDAANPTDPSTTQALMVRFCGARHRVGPNHPGFGRMYTAPVTIDQHAPHEIDLRLELLRPLPGEGSCHALSLPELPPPAAGSPLDDLLGELRLRPFAVINVGARLSQKRLTAPQYAELADLVHRGGATPVLTYGPRELDLARRAWSQSEAARLAPPTSVAELAALMGAARFVLSCDTGPMHLAVAAGTPTCGLFVATPPQRYGYDTPPHTWVDVRRGLTAESLAKVSEWVHRQLATSRAAP